VGDHKFLEGDVLDSNDANARLIIFIPRVALPLFSKGCAASLSQDFTDRGLVETSMALSTWKKYRV
jgi:hypothetical protein